MSLKKELLNKMVSSPRTFDDTDFLHLVHYTGSEALTFDDLRENIRRIYDMNENALLKESDPLMGSLSGLIRRRQRRRRKHFFSRISNKLRTADYKTIVAEGDSWFCFPFYVTDINEWLLKDKRINLYSIAAAGDWMANMIYEGKYIEELSMIKPDVFLISGGGNDFVGSNRLAFMIDTNVDEELPDEKYIDACVTDAFYAFIHTLKAQYWMIFDSLAKAKKFDRMKIITQGYDYVRPSPKKFRGPDLLQWIINLFTDTGNWVYRPFLLKGLSNEKKQQLIINHFIKRVNEMFEWLACYKNPGSDEYRFPNLYHVDCRGVARDFDDWFDEIHLKSDRFGVIAEAYKHIIFEPVGFKHDKKVINAIDFDNQ